MTVSVRAAIISAKNAADWAARSEPKEDALAAFERELEARGFAVVPLLLPDEMRLAWVRANDCEEYDELWGRILHFRPRVGVTEE